MRIKFFATLREIVGGRIIEIPTSGETSAQELLDQIIGTYPALRHELLEETGNLRGHVHFHINGRDVQFTEAGMKTKLAFDDEITIFPAVGGG